MPLVDCDCDAEWADYLTENYTLARFAHLRPSGFVRLPSYEWPSDRSCEVILSGPPGCGKEAVLAALEGPGGFSLQTYDSLYSRDQFLRRWSHRTAEGEHVVTTLLGKNRELLPPECFAYRYTLNSVFDRARAGVNFSDDISQEEIVALVEELTELTARRRVWAFYLRGTPRETYARLGPGAGSFDAHLREHADADSFYTTTECPHVTPIWTDGKTVDAVKDEILERVKSFTSNWQ